MTPRLADYIINATGFGKPCILNLANVVNTVLP
jgi:hypothetical protein